MCAKDKLIAKFIRAGRRHRWLKCPFLLLTTLTLAFYHAVRLFRRNGRRLSAVLGALVVCAVSSSFVSQVNGAATYQPQAAAPVYASTEVTAVTAVSAPAGSSASKGQKKAVIEPVEDDVWEADDFLFADEELVYADDAEVADREVSVHAESGSDIVIYDTDGSVRQASFEDDWKLILVNKQNPVPEGYSFDLATLKGNMKVDARIIDPTIAMLQAAQKDGVTLVICSAFRDNSRQSALFNKKINAYTQKGLSYWEAYAKTSYSVTIPGTSEHELGLAMDIVCSSYYTLDAGYAETEAGKWLAENCYKYGFILRYPLGKENITGITFEPWHFRYVGVEAATEMTIQEITLEEYVEQIGLK